jgi:peroxiredoxin Q/BCP
MNIRVLLALSIFLSMSLFSSAARLDVGDSAPSAAGTTDTGEELVLNDVYAANEYTLVYFYPKADTPGCTAQGCSLRDSYETLLDKGVAVIGVSIDSVEDQKAFKEKYRLPFPLIADIDKQVVKAFGVPSLMGFAKRQAFLIKGGQVIWADYSASTRDQAADVLKVIASQ